MNHVMLDRVANDPIHTLRAPIEGRIILPSDAEYDASRTTTLGFAKRPAFIIRPANAADVARAVGLARDTGLELAIRSGGHSVAGYSTSEGGIVLDLRDMKKMEFDAEAMTAWAEPGLTAGEFTTAAWERGFVVGFGDAATVGLGGIVTGGGMGYLSRVHGLTIDNLLAVEIVTADGRIVIADETNEPDLFWAVRGGGGNFGVITRFKFRMWTLPDFTGGVLILPATVETITGFVTASLAAPDALSTIANIMPCPPLPFAPPEAHGMPVIMGMMAYTGPADEAAAALAPFRALSTPIADLVGPAPYTAMYPPEEDHSMPAAVRSTFSNRIGIEEAQAIMGLVTKPGFHIAQLRVLGGAIARVPVDATAYAHRQSKILSTGIAFVANPAEWPERIGWAETFMFSMMQDDTGVYVNFVGDEGEARVRDAYPGATWDRLRRVKAAYDPANLFRLNQNIPPAV